jgi:hypothetical protein
LRVAAAHKAKPRIDGASAEDLDFRVSSLLGPSG